MKIVALFSTSTSFDFTHLIIDIVSSLRCSSVDCVALGELVLHTKDLQPATSDCEGEGLE